MLQTWHQGQENHVTGTSRLAKNMFSQTQLPPRDLGVVESEMASLRSWFSCRGGRLLDTAKCQILWTSHTCFKAQGKGPCTSCRLIDEHALIARCKVPGSGAWRLIPRCKGSKLWCVAATPLSPDAVAGHKRTTIRRRVSQTQIPLQLRLILLDVATHSLGGKSLEERSFTRRVLVC